MKLSTLSIFLVAGLFCFGLFTAVPTNANAAMININSFGDAMPLIGLAGLIVNRDTLSGITTSFNAIFNQVIEGIESTHSMVSMTVPSTTRENDYRWLGRMKSMREWIGDRVVTNLLQDGYKITNKSYENTVGVDRDDIEDDQLGIYNPMIADLAQTSGELPDDLIWDLVKNGGTQLCYDGQYFFDTDHPVLDANGDPQSVSNHGGGASTEWYLFDTSRAIQPLIFQDRKKAKLIAKDNENDDNVFMRKEFLYGVDMRCNAGYGLWQLAYASKQTLNTANFNAAYAAMMSMKGDHDRQINIKPLLLVVPPSLREEANATIQAERLANGETNTNRNVVKIHVEQRVA